MSSFCGKCGRPLADGEVCTCSVQQLQVNRVQEQGENGFSSFLASVGQVFEKVKNHMGIGDPDLNKGDAYEKKKQIIPDCVKANEGEVPVKQYEIAKLRNRVIGIPYSKAIGRLQVTNKRVIFRAPGRSIVGRTTLQNEFAIDEIAGIEARREYVFNIWDVIFGLLLMALGTMVGSFLVMLFAASEASLIALSLLFGLAGAVPFALLKKKWWLKILCLGVSAGSFVSGTMVLSGLFAVLTILTYVCIIFCMIYHSIKPNLVLVVKSKATEAISIRRKKKSFLFGGQGEKDDHTGYEEILPLDDTETSIREIGALINDIQKLGDYAITKWKQ